MFSEKKQESNLMYIDVYFGNLYNLFVNVYFGNLYNLFVYFGNPYNIFVLIIHTIYLF